jgi:nitrate/TMAO reductase-like tetraheme cytochrome c subunit
MTNNVTNLMAVLGANESRNAFRVNPHEVQPPAAKEHYHGSDNIDDDSHVRTKCLDCTVHLSW